MAAHGVRITGGRLRGRLLAVPKGLRPTAATVREALGSIWRDRLPGARLADLFAGSGAVGLEAASRGAAQVVLIEAHRGALRVLERNCAELAPGVARVVRGQLPRDLDRSGLDGLGPFDLLFVDPPYDFEDYRGLLARLVPWLAPGGELAVEHACRTALPETVGPLTRREHRRYGDTCVSFYCAALPSATI